MFACLKMGIADAAVAKQPIVIANTILLIKARPPDCGIRAPPSQREQTTAIDLSDQPLWVGKFNQ